MSITLTDPFGDQRNSVYCKQNIVINEFSPELNISFGICEIIKEMNVKKEPDRCRVCYARVIEYINIFEETASTLNLIDSLKQYFYDRVIFNIIHTLNNMKLFMFL